jgi:hypothetical protein
LYLIYQRDWEQIRDQNAFIDRDTAQILAAVTDHKSLKHMIAKTKGGFRMCTALDELYEEGMEKGLEQIIISSLKKNRSCQDIAEFNDLDIQFVMRVAKENGFPVK